jgi:hypothetical protein
VDDEVEDFHRNLAVNGVYHEAWVATGGETVESAPSVQYPVVAMMTSRSLFAVVPVSVLLGAPAAHEQQQPQTQPQRPTLRATTRLVVVDVIVTDDENRPVPDLQASDFVVREDGKPQKIAAFARLPCPRNSVAAARCDVTAMFLMADIAWREAGVIEWRVR